MACFTHDKVAKLISKVYIFRKTEKEAHQFINIMPLAMQMISYFTIGTDYWEGGGFGGLFEPTEVNEFLQNFTLFDPTPLFRDPRAPTRPLSPLISKVRN